MHDAACHNLDFATALMVGIERHSHYGLDPAHSVIITSLPNDGLNRMIRLQLEVEVLQAACLIREESEEVAPISPRATIDVWMMRDSHVPSEAADASQSLMRKHFFQETPGGTVFDELESVGRVKSLDGLRVDASTRHDERQQSRRLWKVFTRGGRWSTIWRIEATIIVVPTIADKIWPPTSVA